MHSRVRDGGQAPKACGEAASWAEDRQPRGAVQGFLVEAVFVLGVSEMGGTLSSWNRWECNDYMIAFKKLLSGAGSGFWVGAWGRYASHTHQNNEAGKYIVIFFSFFKSEVWHELLFLPVAIPYSLGCWEEDPKLMLFFFSPPSYLDIFVVIR